MNLLNFKFRIDRIIFGIFIVALLLRLWGINYGLPLFLNIDEPATVSATFEIKNQFYPGRFDWPHLFLYMNAAAYAVFSILRYIIQLFFDLPILNDPASFLFVSRFLTALMGALTVFPIYYAAKELFNSKRIAYLSALILTFLPIHSNESHLAKLDVPQTLFASIAFYFIIRVFKYGGLKNYLWAGFLIGLTTSVKYNGFLLFLPLLIASILNNKEWKQFISIDFYKNLFLSGILSILTFYLGTPYALIAYEKFWSTERGIGVLWQFQNVGKVTLLEYPAEVYETFFTMYKDNLGVGLWIIFSILIILFLFFNKREKHYILTIFPVILLSLYVSMLDRSPSHYYLTFVPMYVLALSIFINDITEFLLQKFKLTMGKNILFSLLTLIILLPSFFLSLKDSYLYSKKDTRNYAYEWVKSNLDENKNFLYVYGEDLVTVSFQKNNTDAIKKTDTNHISEEKLPFYLLIGQKDIVREELVEGLRDPANVEGDSERILKYADLVFEVDSSKRLGPPIYIFYVDTIEPKTKFND